MCVCVWQPVACCGCGKMCVYCGDPSCVPPPHRVSVRGRGFFFLNPFFLLFSFSFFFKSSLFHRVPPLLCPFVFNFSFRTWVRRPYLPSSNTHLGSRLKKRGHESNPSRSPAAFSKIFNSINVLIINFFTLQTLF